MQEQRGPGTFSVACHTRGTGPNHSLWLTTQGVITRGFSYARNTEPNHFLGLITQGVITQGFSADCYEMSSET